MRSENEANQLVIIRSINYKWPWLTMKFIEVT